MAEHRGAPPEQKSSDDLVVERQKRITAKLKAAVIAEDMELVTLILNGLSPSEVRLLAGALAINLFAGAKE